MLWASLIWLLFSLSIDLRVGARIGGPETSVSGNKKALNHINYKGEGFRVNGEHLVCSGNLLVLNKLECHCVTSC